MATTSLGSSTTQMTSSDRRGSRQMRHCSPSATLKQVVQKRTSSCTRVSAATSRPTSADSAASRWKAIRWALLGPTPGNRPSSSIRAWTAPSYTVFLEFFVGRVGPAPLVGWVWSEPGGTEAPGGSGEGAHRLGGEFVPPSLGVPDGGDDQVLQRLEVVRVDGGGRDREPGQLTAAGHGRNDQFAARGTGDFGVRELLLGCDQLLLHLLRLLEQLRHVWLTSGEHGTRVGREHEVQRHADAPESALDRASARRPPEHRNPSLRGVDDRLGPAVAGRR